MGIKVNIKKISEETGFSPATISNALNHKKGVNAQTAERIFEVARELGYFSEDRVSKLKFVMYKKSGVVVEDTPFFTQMIAGAEQECRNSGMEMVMCNLDRRSANFEEQLRIMQNDKSSAVILLGTEMMDEDIDIIRGMTGRFLVIDYWNGDLSYNAVLINNTDAARLATDYLIDRGHTRIGYLRGDFRIKPFTARHSGYRSSLRRHGIPEDEAYTVTLGTTIDKAYSDMKAYLEGKPELPTAFFADNDMIALGALKALQDCGIRVPDDISVIGFDDLPFSSISSPPLTTLRVEKQAMGRVAVRLLREMGHNEDDPPLKIQVCPQFVERESVKTLRREA